MKVSEYYKLAATQPSLDFVDVPVDGDIALFIDPTALSLLDTEWGKRCRSLVQDYFSIVLKAINDGDHAKARALLSVLNEPNETRLGYSSEHPRGHGMGKKLARKMWVALRDSTSVHRGLIQNLEDTALLIDGIASDIISDITTNIIREPLLEYTQAMCAKYDIPVERGIASRPMWDSLNKKWHVRHVDQPVADGKRLLLAPKILVRKAITFQADNYYNLYLLERLQEEHAAKGFVRLLKKGGAKPLTKKELRGKLGAGKEANRLYTPGREDVLEKYRIDKAEQPKPPLAHSEIAKMTGSKEPDWKQLLETLSKIKPGKQEAKAYEVAIKELFDTLFYPWLGWPEIQERIHDGRKVIDLTYVNAAEDDFFAWVRNNYFAPHVIIECKNYNGDPKNPELDQLSGRFSTRRGQFGILVCRKIGNKELFDQRCKDTAADGRGFIIAIDDDDIADLAVAIQHGKQDERLNLLRNKFRQLLT